MLEHVKVSVEKPYRFSHQDVELFKVRLRNINARLVKPTKI